MEWKKIRGDSYDFDSEHVATSGNLGLVVYQCGCWNSGYSGNLPCYRFKIYVDGIELYKPAIDTRSRTVAMSAAESFATMWHEVIGRE